MKLYWNRKDEKTITANATIVRCEYTIEMCDGKVFLKDCRYMPDGFFKLTKDKGKCYEKELATCSINDGVEGLKQAALEDVLNQIEPYRKKRRVLIRPQGTLDCTIDHVFGDDYVKVVDGLIKKANELLAPIGVTFCEWNDYDEYIGIVNKVENGKIDWDFDCYDIDSIIGITKIKTNEELGIEDLK